MAASTVTEVNDRVQTVLTAAGITDAINNHAGLIDDLDEGATKIVSYAIHHTAFAAGAGAQTFVAITPSATRSACIEDVCIHITEVVAGGSLSAVTAEAGQTAGPDTDAYVVAQSVFTGATLGYCGLTSGTWGVDRVLATRQPILAPGESITITFTPTGDDLENATSGNILVFAKYILI